jgi:cell division transport system permease protein
LQIIIYFKDSTSTEAINKTKTQIAQYVEVDSVKFVSRDEALTILKSSLKGQDGILEGLTENPLPSSLEIKLKKDYLNLESIEKFVKEIKTNDYFEDIEYGQKWLERFVTFFEILKITGFILGGFLFLFTLLIISNTIKLLFHSRREEIEIMKLVGATNRFIKIPFCIEGIILGLIGASIGLFFIYLSGNLVMNRSFETLHFYLSTHHFIFLDPTIVMYVLILGAVLGLAGSLLSLKSFQEIQS